MKLHALELTGFGPFREMQRVDFDAFDRDGVFLISGRTGTGKSSILDGVSFALYGTVPRYEGGEKRLRSDHSFLTDPTEVRLEFTAGDARWRVTRAPEYDRPAKRGGGLTTEPARAELEELRDGVWIGRAAKPRDVGLALGEILGLGAQQFQQVILLAQNKFSRFLLAPGDERQILLRTLFGTRRFEQYQADLDERRREAQKRLDSAGEHARTLLGLAERLIAERALGSDGDDDAMPATESGGGDLAARSAAVLAAVGRAAYRVDQATTSRARAEEEHRARSAAHVELVERARRSRERAEARTRLTQLEHNAPRIEAQRALLSAARAADALRAPLDAADRAARELDDARAEERRAHEAWAGGVELAREVDPAGDVDVDLEAAEIAVREITADLARWEDAAEAELALAPVRERAAAYAAALAETDAALAALGEQLAEVPVRRLALEERLTSARAVAARAEDLRARCTRLEAHVEAARAAERHAPVAAAAERAYLEASAAAAAAGLAVTDLLQRRLAGYAGELSAALAPGEPCAVCGSREHPHPAAPASAPVTDEDLAAAEATRDAAHARANSAAATARAARDELAAAQADAGGRDRADLEAELDLVRTDLDAASAGARDVDLLSAERADLDRIADAAEAERDALTVRRLADREEQAAANAEIARLEEAVARARGQFESVAARIADGEARRTRAAALVAARATMAERQRAWEAATVDVERLLVDSPFDAPGAVRAALRTPAEIAAAEGESAAHAAEITATRERLLELELALVGAEVTGDEVEEAASLVAAADTARSAAIAAERDAQNVWSQLRDLSERADDAYADVAELAADAASVTRLADTVAGRAPNTMKMDLETFVLAAELEEIVAAANVRLAEMSAGRYTLHHSDARAARGRASGLGIDVLDAHTGRLRTPQSLSGGETFLASLALALGLGEVVTARAGGIRLDTLFVDEGFGSLDPETLELAMRTLDDLRVGGRTVGVISHVEAMKEQLPAQLVVEATPQGPSIIRQEAAVRS
ncbi:MAG: SMC family ATPase [Microbacterium sp.]|uniref:AAA family ATPase n=1 Tax=Microbacterium sp. TaxID=51671 RepID=UPI001AC908C9|nr:SMC family ATPase [Microbacterium sp.]MBN9178082.1 SMC family ATPase [Microbacterium sp.]